MLTCVFCIFCSNFSIVFQFFFEGCLMPLENFELGRSHTLDFTTVPTIILFPIPRFFVWGGEVVEASVGIEGIMASSVCHWVLCWAFRASGFLFSNIGLNTHIETQKQYWKNTYLFLVTDRSGLYLAWRPVYLKLIIYINLSIIVNKIQ